MSKEVEIQELLSSHASYNQYIGTLFLTIEQSREINQAIRNIILFCKTLFGANAKAIGKLLSLILIRDMLMRYPTPELLVQLQKNILSKVRSICIEQFRDPRKSRLSSEGSTGIAQYQAEERKKDQQQLQQISLESIYSWAKVNGTASLISDFVKVFEDLKKLKVVFPNDFRYYKKYVPIEVISEQDIVARKESQQSKQILRKTSITSRPLSQSGYSQGLQLQSLLLQRYTEAIENIENQLSKLKKTPSYRPKVSEILDQLESIVHDFQEGHFGDKQSQQYKDLSSYVDMAKDLTERLSLRKNPREPTIRRAFQEIVSHFRGEQEPGWNNPTTNSPSAIEHQLKRFDIFEILENIHRRIEHQERAQGLFGSYEIKYGTMEIEDPLEGLRPMAAQRGRITLSKAVSPSRGYNS